MLEVRLRSYFIEEYLIGVASFIRIVNAAADNSAKVDDKPEQCLLFDDEGKPGLLVGWLRIVAERYRLRVLCAQSRRLLLVVFR